jgi:selenocysteine lyase/cysteine desulfurase
MKSADPAQEGGAAKTSARRHYPALELSRRLGHALSTLRHATTRARQGGKRKTILTTDAAQAATAIACALRCADCTVLCTSIVTVIGPTPPGTGEM